MDSFNYDDNDGADHDSFERFVPMQWNVGYCQGQGHGNRSYDPTQQPCTMDQSRHSSYSPAQQPYVGQGQGMSYYPGNGSSFHVCEKISTYEVRNQHPPADCSYYNTDRSMPSMSGSLLNGGGSQCTMDGSQGSGYGQVRRIEGTFHHVANEPFRRYVYCGIRDNGSFQNTNGLYDENYSSGNPRNNQQVASNFPTNSQLPKNMVTSQSYSNSNAVQYSAINCPSSSSAGYGSPCDPHVSSLESSHPIQQHFNPGAISNEHAWNGNSGNEGNEGITGSGIGATGISEGADGSGWKRPNDATSSCSTPTQLVPCPLKQQRPLEGNLLIASTMSSNQQAISDGNLSKQRTLAVKSSKKSARNKSDLTKDELELFVEKFRQNRIEMGLQQAEVGKALRRIYGNELSQTTVSRFEVMKHSLPTMNKLKRILEDWLKRTKAGHSEDASSDSSQSSSNGNNAENVDPAENTLQINARKRRTPVTGQVKDFLKSEFNKQSVFSAGDVKRIADAVNLEPSVVKNWFHNQRQRVKRATKHSGSSMQQDASGSNA